MPTETADNDDAQSRRELAEVRQTVERTMEGLLSSGLLPYEGEWLSVEEHRERQLRDRRRARLHFFEIGLLNLALLLMSGILMLLVWLLAY